MRNICYRIPNVFLQMFDKAAELKIATVFYTLTNKQSMRNINGDYVLSVSQETLSRLSGLSVSTIKRTVDKLCAQGFIISQTRPKSNRRADNGALMLDKYLYTIKYIPRNSDYFCVDRTALRKVNGQAFEVYMHFSMLSDSITRAFFHSLTDLCDIIKIGKKELIKAIETLIKHKLIRKIQKRTRYGDFSDNTYVISSYTPAKPKPHAPPPIKTKKVVPRMWRSGELQTKPCFKFKTKVIINHFLRFVKGQIEKSSGIFKFLTFRGSG